MRIEDVAANEDVRYLFDTALESPHLQGVETRMVGAIQELIRVNISEVDQNLRGTIWSTYDSYSTEHHPRQFQLTIWNYA